MRRLRSAIKADYLILGKSLHAGKPKIDQLHVKKTHQFQHLHWLHCLQSPYSMRSQFLFKMTGSVGRSVGRSILTFVKGPDIKKQEKRVCHAVTMHILTKDYSNFVIYTVWFSFLSLKIWFVVGSSFLLVQFDAYLAK